MERFEHLKMIYDERAGDIDVIKSKIIRGESPKREMVALNGANMLYAINALYKLQDNMTTQPEQVL